MLPILKWVLQQAELIRILNRLKSADIHFNLAVNFLPQGLVGFLVAQRLIPVQIPAQLIVVRVPVPEHVPEPAAQSLIIHFPRPGLPRVLSGSV